ncbi:MAG: hypothetical protein QOK39_2643, partial [Acidimicrobiaceae bacterium]|nr:hypothetical protein [Acidimicrobiaceae bacterium]
MCPRNLRIHNGLKFPDVWVGVLGPLEVITDDGPTVIGAPKERAVLALLALHVGTSVRPDEVIDALWGETPPRSAGKTVQTYVSHLRRYLPPKTISTTAGGYCLQTAEVDLTRFEGLLRKSRRSIAAGEFATAAEALSDALCLWRGPPLPDLADQPRGSGEAVRLTELHHMAEEDLVELWLVGAGEPDIARLEAAVGAEPLRERRWAQLMLALYRAGRQADALRAFQRVRRLLDVELGVSPGAALVELEQAILTQDPRLQLAPPRPGARFARRLGAHAELPVAANPFIGRESECDVIAGLLEETRLVTIVGPGGCGKTRLAIEVANLNWARYADGVVLARLASVGEEAVVSQVAAAFVVEAEPDQPLLATLVAALADREVLVVMDNCEHVIEAATTMAETLVSSCGRVSVLATSREALRSPSEHRFSLGPLPRTAAVKLFAERARAARGRPLHEGELGSIDEICRRLDGLPLALEIAAARCQAFSAHELLVALDDCLALTGLRTSEDRHQTLRAAIDWSYRLLSEPEKWLFRRMSVFAGGTTHVQLKTFNGPVDVSLLVDKSLVIRSASDASGPTVSRLTMHETVRQFAADLLWRAGEAVAASRDHANVYLAVAETAASEIRGRNQLDAIARLGTEHENLAAAISWGLHDGEPEVSARFGRALWWYWFRTGQPTQGRTWIEQALMIGPCDPEGEARAAAGYLAWDTDDFAVAIGHATTVLA